MIRTTRDGTKLYPVCNWERNQHKIDVAYTKSLNRLYDARETGEGIDKAEEQVARMEEARKWIDNVMQDGIVYAPYPIYRLLKDIIGAYDITH